MIRVKTLFRRFKARASAAHKKVLMKRRARKLGIVYQDGIFIGKRIQRWNETEIIMSKNSRIGDDCVLWGGGTILLGERTSIGEQSWIFASKRGEGGVVFGNDVNCAARLYLIDCDHGYKGDGPINRQAMVYRQVRIGNDVWIAANVTIIKGTVIGDHSVVGACALCNKVYPEHSVLVGVPARAIKSTR